MMNVLQTARVEEVLCETCACCTGRVMAGRGKSVRTLTCTADCAALPVTAAHAGPLLNR